MHPLPGAPAAIVDFLRVSLPTARDPCLPIGPARGACVMLWWDPGPRRKPRPRILLAGHGGFRARSRCPPTGTPLAFPPPGPTTKVRPVGNGPLRQGRPRLLGQARKRGPGALAFLLRTGPARRLGAAKKGDPGWIRVLGTPGQRQGRSGRSRVPGKRGAVGLCFSTRRQGTRLREWEERGGTTLRLLDVAGGQRIWLASRAMESIRGAGPFSARTQQGAGMRPSQNRRERVLRPACGDVATGKERCAWHTGQTPRRADRGGSCLLAGPAKLGRFRVRATSARGK